MNDIIASDIVSFQGKHFHVLDTTSEQCLLSGEDGGWVFKETVILVYRKTEGVSQPAVPESCPKIGRIPGGEVPAVLSLLNQHRLAGSLLFRRDSENWKYENVYLHTQDIARYLFLGFVAGRTY